MVLRIRFPIKSNSLKIPLPKISIYSGKKTWCRTSSWFTFTRCLLDIWTWNVSNRRFMQTSYLMRPLSLTVRVENYIPPKWLTVHKIASNDCPEFPLVNISTDSRNQWNKYNFHYKYTINNKHYLYFTNIRI